MCYSTCVNTFLTWRDRTPAFNRHAWNTHTYTRRYMTHINMTHTTHTYTTHMAYIHTYITYARHTCHTHATQMPHTCHMPPSYTQSPACCGKTNILNPILLNEETWHTTKCGRVITFCDQLIIFSCSQYHFSIDKFFLKVHVHFAVNILISAGKLAKSL